MTPAHPAYVKLTTALPARNVPLSRPLRWLRLGWRDFRRVPWPGMLHGVLVAAGGLAIFAATLQQQFMLVGAVSGFVIVGPILATGLYELSRLISRGQQPTLRDAVAAWRRGTGPLVWMGVLLGIAGTLWVGVSAALFALFVRVPITGPETFLRYVAAVQGDFLFLMWLVAGALGAAVVFAATAVSPPLMLGRKVGLRLAVLTSVRAVGENPGAMALWAALIMVATALSLATFMAGFVIAIPVIGHATWHAYRDVVDTAGTALRN